MGAHHKGTHEGCPYETRKMFANKRRIYGIAMQSHFASDHLAPSFESNTKSVTSSDDMSRPRVARALVTVAPAPL